MSTLNFIDTHNMVAFFSKPAKSEGFEQIVDFLNAHPLKYALTVNPTIYTLCVTQFWSTVKVKTINREVQLQALVDGKKVIITKAIVRRDLQLSDDEDKQVEGMESHKKIYEAPCHTKKIFANMRRQGKDFSGRVTPLFQTIVVQAQTDIGEGLAIP
ncbi:hypothetical protein Tco_0500259, partial [Tanacetum coccineum]